MRRFGGYQPPGPDADRMRAGSTSPVVSGTAQPSAAAPDAAVPVPASAEVTKVLVFVEENHSLAQMQAEMPYAFGLAQQFGYATNYTAIRHPSLPTYVAIAGGQTYGITDDESPSVHPLSGTSVFGQAIAAGKTAAVYADGMPGNCATSNGGSDYAVKHNPWAYFTAERAECRQYDVPINELDQAVTDGNLPTVGMVVPNLCNDAHDCSRHGRRLVQRLDDEDLRRPRLAVGASCGGAHGRRRRQFG